MCVGGEGYGLRQDLDGGRGPLAQPGAVGHFRGELGQDPALVGADARPDGLKGGSGQRRKVGPADLVVRGLVRDAREGSGHLHGRHHRLPVDGV